MNAQHNCARIQGVVLGGVMVTSRSTWLATPISHVSYMLPLGVHVAITFYRFYLFIQRNLFRVP